ncbi:holo-[acyl-carrier protein] synthase [Desulfobaculum xiamenense]|uniref:Holo-[acyl-carrier-protein] synthase n=1 Tax=Desulfobaculum xiamenense TaxID=995050 RepID=A0A846QNE9_9BACT|nr:holo-[acyl-carrier-protein] synthase [Desulfobaculum xiamenense]NJB66754.1 holo-[acyl-carrier protein] synthase [Desulfobaculum xiamenense]
MIIGLGLDVVELARIEQAVARHGDHFIDRILTPNERSAMPAVATPYLAARFAAKEAAAKALGTGIAKGVGFQTIEIRRLPSGQPQLELLGAARELAESLGVNTTHISLTHGRDIASAVVVLEKN